MIDSISEQADAAAKKSKWKKKPAMDPTKLDRLPPHSVEAEQGVLGCILWEANESLGECIEKIKPGTEMFYDGRHQIIYGTLLEMYDKKEAIDLITLQQRLKEAKHEIKGGFQTSLEMIGGVTYLSALQDSVPSAANLSYYLEIVCEQYEARTWVRECTDIVAKIYDNQFTNEPEKFFDSCESQIMTIGDFKAQSSSPTANSLVQAAISKIEFIHQNQGALLGLSTGFLDLDKMTSGLQGGDMWVLAARPSMGKTSMGVQIAEHVCVELQEPVGVFSLEMTAESLMLRALCSRARVNIRDVMAGFLVEQSFNKLTAAAAHLSHAPLFIDDSAGLSILQLRAKARRMHQQHGIKLLVIDYLQLLHSTSRKASENRQIEVSEVSSGIKAMAKELGIPVIVLAQLNRELEKRIAGSKPKLSDLRESGSIEQDADLVGLLYKPDSEEDQSGAEAIPVKLAVAKQRNGPTGDVNFTFLKGYTRFELAAKVDDEDVPPSPQTQSTLPYSDS